MIATIRHYVGMLKASLWLVPAFMSAMSIGAAYLLLTLPARQPWALALEQYAYAGDADSARDLLAALLSGMISMFTLALSITMVVLSLAAQQLGPRLVRNFMDDRVTQWSLGLFMATVLYLLIVLRTLSGDRAPQLAVTFGTLLSGVCLFVLLYFFDRLARSIVFENVATRVMSQVDDTRRWVAERAEANGAAGAAHAELDTIEARFGSEASIVMLRGHGYVQSVSYERLLEIAESSDTVLRVHVAPGAWVVHDSRCVSVVPAHACDDAMNDAIRRAFIIGAERTAESDVEYALQRLVEVALRALSPGINDTFTAITAINNLATAVALVWSGAEPSPMLRDGSGKVRVVRAASDPAALVGSAFDAVRHAGARIPVVASGMLDVLGRLAAQVCDERRRDAVMTQIEAVFESARAHEMIAQDARRVREAYAAARGPSFRSPGTAGAAPHRR